MKGKLVTTAAAVFALAMILAAAAFPYAGRFDASAKIVPHGLKVSGPNNFDADEVGAVVHATVTQDGAIASGDSAYTSAASWSASLRGSGFHTGAANGRATATIYEVDGGTETYTWTQRITLK